MIVPTDIPVTMTPEQLKPGPKESVPFYTATKQFNGTVKVPALVTKEVENIDFKDYSFTVFCCPVKVCVPCKSTTTCTTVCTIDNLPAAMEAKTRRNGNVDVYALNVPSMPNRYVTDFNITPAELFTRYNVKLD